MCIIAYKPSGVEFFEKEILENCFYNNPDGAGYAIKRKSSRFVEYQKGFFTFAELYAALMAEDIAVEDELAVHCRIATNGATIAKNCHPFFLTEDEKSAYSTAGTCKSVLFHNGVLSKKYSSDKAVSDTYLFTLALARREKVLIAQKTLKNFIERETEGSRILYFAEHGTILTGKWEQDGGYFFSNLSYLSYEDRYSAFYNDNYSYYNWNSYGVKCPICGGREAARIAEFYDLQECPDCGALFDSHGREIELFYKEAGRI